LQTAEPGKRDVYHDTHDDTAGLTLRVTDRGSKSFVIEKWVHGRNWKMTLGPFGDGRGELGIVAARRKARRVLDELEEGTDPKEAERERQREAEAAEARKRGITTVASLVPGYIERVDKRNAGRRWRDEQQRIFDRYVVPVWGSRSVDEVTRDDVTELLTKIARQTPIAANRLYSCLNSFFSYVIRLPKSPLPGGHPVTGLERPASEKPRQHVLNDSEIAMVWSGAASLSPPFNTLVRIALLTGCRKSEVTTMRWSDVDLDNGLWTLPRTKSGNAHTVPINPMLRAILERLAAEDPERVAAGGYVFAAENNEPPQCWQFHLRRIQKQNPKLRRFRGHDLRRSLRTALSRLGVSRVVAEAVIGHRARGVVGVYDLYDHLVERKDALARWESHLGKLGCC
jgi:integrase